MTPLLSQIKILYSRVVVFQKSSCSLSIYRSQFAIFQKFKGDAHSLCKSKINTSQPAVIRDLSFFPRALPIPEKKCTFPFLVLSLNHLASCINAMLDKGPCLLMVASLSLYKLIQGNQMFQLLKRKERLVRSRLKDKLSFRGHASVEIALPWG